MRTIRFGIIGSGLMGREFAAAAARWCHLPGMEVRPELTALCTRNVKGKAVEWFTGNFPSISQVTGDYMELVRNPDIDAVYCAVPHHLHEEFYCAVLDAGKHLMGEKPFGIDEKANRAILAKAGEHPECFVRCSSQFPFFPAVQRLCDMIEERRFGRIIEVEAGFLHSSDLNPSKPLNWKRMIEYNGEYGSMGDLGMHVCHIPFRAGWIPRNVRAHLSNIFTERPDGGGGTAPCETWDNATLFCETVDTRTGDTFPMTLKMHRIAPGEKNTWYISVLGTKASAKFSTKNPKRLEVLEYEGKEQAWRQLDTGHETAFETVTGGIFEFGFSGAVLQMWAAYLYELEHGEPLKKFAGCVLPEETALSHRLFTAALESQERREVVSVRPGGRE